MKTKSVVTRLLGSSPFNLIINNFFWVGCVVGRYEWLWLVAPGVLAYAGFLVVKGIVQPYQLFWTVTMGIVIDSFLTAIGFFHFPQDNALLPLWMWVLWLAFATTLPLSLKILGSKPYLAGITGALGFPVSYLLGAQLGAVSFALPAIWTALILAAVWAVFLPMLFKCIEPVRRFSGEST